IVTQKECNQLPSALRKVAVVIGALGPYHIARLTALHRLLDSRGSELVLVLRNGRVSEYPWFADPTSLGFAVERAFCDKNPEPHAASSAVQLFRVLQK